MADTTAVFDKLVFDFGFDIVDIIPVILKAVVDRQYYHIAAGQEAAVTLYVIDNMTTPGKRYLFNPALGPYINIFKPDNTQFLAATAMPQVETGVFTYTVFTTPTDQLGPYSAIFTATNGDVAMVSRKYHLFTIIP